MTQASRLVPPTSKEISDERPVASPRLIVPAMPPAGPEKTVRRGDTRAISEVMAPPAERMIRKEPPNPPRRSRSSRSVRYLPRMGRM